MIEHKKSSAIMVFNDKGELALQLRAAHDDSFPSHWDFSAGGGIDPGEAEKASAERELFEELGVKIDIEFVTEENYTYPAWKPSVTRETELWIYRTHHNGPFTLDPTEVERVEFFSFETIAKMMVSGHKFHPEFVLSWNKGIIS
ncbi:NUDIX domain-containing protein [Patescibacteria group bacterium]|nr:NUDIX domain-containing protein [Patescibacteria group bacterium]